MRNRRKRRLESKKRTGEERTSPATPEAGPAAGHKAGQEAGDRPSRQESRDGLEGVAALIEQRDRLYDEARENPASEANEMVRSFLLSGMLSIRSEASEEAELDEVEAEPGSPSVPAGVRGERRRRELETRIREQEFKLEEVAKAAQEAAAAAAAGQPFDAMAVYDRIAEIVGLRPSADELQNPYAPRSSAPDPPAQ